ncbi:MAG: glycosyltransferase family 2 protein [Eubacterium sp.]|jgi:cellulose synthase/poly-beta-1,6-N-acetylglucosamine synthase-like glycosyltransferase|nr:glycosyltransferase family 2 protein [Eubacterium sp.]
MEIFKLVHVTVTVILLACFAYRFFYIPVSLLMKKKTKPETAAQNRYAILICARNEEKVIADLIGSIKSQTYDAGLLSVFVIADNCEDMTADVARAAGASVYERFNTQLVGKGYALDELVKHISRDYPNRYDGYFVFDADNILDPDYIEKMNLTFSEGCEIVTGYRNSKNYGDNWISAGYSLWFMHSSRFLNQARSLLGLSCNVSGTGFLFSQSILDKTNGWQFHTLTEDFEFTIHHILNGEKVGFCLDAVLYDEQPVKFRQSWHQRTRWAKGYLQVFGRYCSSLFRGAARGNFSCFDLGIDTISSVILTAASVTFSIALFIIMLVNGESVLSMLQTAGRAIICMYLAQFIMAIFTTVSEWNKIRASSSKKLIYTLTFPIFMFTYIPVSLSALFAKAEWKPIEHRVSASTLGDSFNARSARGKKRAEIKGQP